MKKLQWSLVTCVWLLMTNLALAGSDNHQLKVKYSMLISGSVVINPDGSVASYSLDKQNLLPPGVVSQMAKVVPQWHFQPPSDSNAQWRNGMSFKTKTRMSVRLVSRPIGRNRMEIGISGTHFEGYDCKPGTCISIKDRVIPKYPPTLAARQVSGTVYVLVQFGRNGKVERAAARKVNLRTSGNPRQMAHWRKLLSQRGVAAVKQWTFQQPVKGPCAKNDHWRTIVPMNFEIVYTSDVVKQRQERYGKWIAYLPGPRQSISWADKQAEADAGVDAVLASANMAPLGTGPRLINGDTKKP